MQKHGNKHVELVLRQLNSMPSRILLDSHSRIEGLSASVFHLSVENNSSENLAAYFFGRCATKRRRGEREREIIVLISSKLMAAKSQGAHRVARSHELLYGNTDLVAFSFPRFENLLFSFSSRSKIFLGPPAASSSTGRISRRISMYICGRNLSTGFHRILRHKTSGLGTPWRLSTCA